MVRRVERPPKRQTPAVDAAGAKAGNGKLSREAQAKIYTAPRLFATYQIGPDLLVASFAVLEKAAPS